MTTAAIVCSAERRPLSSDRPGGALPHGLAELEQWMQIEWVARHRGRLAGSIRSRVDGVLRRLSPGLRGFSIGRAARAASVRADVVLSVFEDAGLAFARMQGGRRVATPHVMVVCWMAEDVAQLSAYALRSVRSSMKSVAAVCVYSSNQVMPLSRVLDLPVDLFHVVPFGVDTEYYDARNVEYPAGGAGVVAVGSDSRRDYATLFDAAAMSGRHMTVACHARNIGNLAVPANVRIVSVYDRAYRELLHHADLVVTPTTAPAYPSGQTVVLEAMAMGRATLTTDSRAMREYVVDGVTGLLVAPRDVAALNDAIERAMGDSVLRRSLGRAGAIDVRARFTISRQWTAVAHVLAEASS